VSGASGRGWVAFCLLWIALWIGATVLVAVVDDDPSDGRPVLLAFATGAALFFGTMSGVALGPAAGRTAGRATERRLKRGFRG
jgi:hypothetical protein